MEGRHVLLLFFVLAIRFTARNHNNHVQMCWKSMYFEVCHAVKLVKVPCFSFDRRKCARQGHRPLFHGRPDWLLIVLLLSGDVELNPGPGPSDCTHQSNVMNVNEHSYASASSSSVSTKGKGSKGTQCAVVNCFNYTKTNKEVAFHSFPKDNAR